MEFKDYYQLLGVPRDATADAIKKAYRQAARKYHPDVSKEADASARMSEVNEAYAALSDPERRAAYDAVGQGRHQGESFTPPPNWDAGFEFSGAGTEAMDDEAFSDFFAQIFGAAGRGMHRGRGASGGAPRADRRGQDHHAKIVLELEDAWRGATQRVTLRSPQLDVEGRVQLTERTLEVKIPVGVKPGQMIRLAGQGAPGQGGAPAGDLFLEVQFGAHPQFRLDGTTLVADLPVAPWEAALGAVVPVRLPDGATLRVRVPPGAQSGRQLTVRGKGLPAATPGDLDLLVRVVLPSGLDPRARKAYDDMAAALPEFDARKVAAAAAERGE